MIKKIIHAADIHIPNSMDSKRPYEEMIKNFIKAVIGEVKELDSPDEARVVLCGDIFHSKVQASNEARSCLHMMLNYLNKICPTIIVAGNHDCILSNLQRVDSLTPSFEIENPNISNDEDNPHHGPWENVTYLDLELGGKSGLYEDDNVIWALYSQFDDFRKPEDMEGLKTAMDNVVPTVIGLYHGSIPGATNDAGYVFEKGIALSEFDQCDLVMCGHIHKYQVIRRHAGKKIIPVIYSGSLFQQDYGENIHPHGYVLWSFNPSKGIYEPEMKEVDNPYRLAHVMIEDYDDIKNDKEELLNV